MKEIDFIKQFTQGFDKPNFQLNNYFESDSEILDISELLQDGLLAISTDSISEEIEYGIYSDPYLIGWMSVISNISDLSASGAIPFGILLNLTLSRDKKNDEVFISKLKNGINDALNTCNTYLIGGDTNFSSNTNIAITALGVTSKNLKLKRTKCNTDEFVYSTGVLGQANCFFANKIFNFRSQIDFKPNHRINESKLISQYASTCIDTSDGFMSSIFQLMNLNNVGFNFTTETSNFITSDSEIIQANLKCSPLTVLAGILGEYELIFTIPKEKNESFNAEASQKNFTPILLGTTTKKQTVTFNVNKTNVEVNINEVVNLYDDNFTEYVQQLIKYFS